MADKLNRVSGDICLTLMKGEKHFQRLSPIVQLAIGNCTPNDQY